MSAEKDVKQKRRDDVLQTEQELHKNVVKSYDLWVESITKVNTMIEEKAPAEKIEEAEFYKRLRSQTWVFYRNQLKKTIMLFDWANAELELAVYPNNPNCVEHVKDTKRVLDEYEATAKKRRRTIILP